MKFYQLPAQLPPLDINQVKGDMVSSFANYRMHTIKDLDYLETVLHAHIHMKIAPTSVYLVEVLPTRPYVAHKQSCATSLNIYLDTANTSTIFWKSAPVAPTMLPVESVENLVSPITAFSYENVDLQYHSHFVPEANQMYLLDTHSVHSIVPGDSIQASAKKRVFIKYFWNNHAIDQITESIGIL